jgi:TolB-like protein/tetratricopeptide (TPR) repeat protein
VTEPSFFQRLKERKLVQWALAYLAGAFVVFQGVEVIAEPWGVSPWTQRAIHLILLAGLFLTLVVAWYHGEKGRQGVSGPELLMVGAVLLVAGVAIYLMGPDSVGPPENPGPRSGSEREDPGEGRLLPDSDPRPSIAVLPFDDNSPDPNDAYFADGMQEQLVLTFSKVRGLRVKGRTSTMRYRQEPKPIPEIAEELGVGFLVEGSARIAGGQVSVTVQLIDANRDEHLWAEEYDRTYSPEILVAVHREVAERVASEVSAVLTPEDQARLSVTPTTSPDAYQEYLKGRFHWGHRSEEGLVSAIADFRRAIELDPVFAAAYSGLADCYAVLPYYFNTVQPREAFTRGLEAARAALELAPDMAAAHASYGYFLLLRDRDWEGAERELRLAISLDPSYPTAHHWLSDLLAFSERFDEAEAEERRALELDPLSFISNFTLGHRFYWRGEIEAAIPHYERTIGLHPNNYLGWASLAAAHYLTGNIDEGARADSVSGLLYGLPPALSGTLVRLASDFHGRGIPGILPPEFDTAGRYPPTGRARVAALVGDTAKALEWLETGVEEGWPDLFVIGVSPLWDPYRENPRFQRLMDQHRRDGAGN